MDRETKNLVNVIVDRLITSGSIPDKIVIDTEDLLDYDTIIELEHVIVNKNDVTARRVINKIIKEKFKGE